MPKKTLTPEQIVGKAGFELVEPDANSPRAELTGLSHLPVLGRRVQRIRTPQRLSRTEFRNPGIDTLRVPLTQ